MPESRHRLLPLLSLLAACALPVAAAGRAPMDTSTTLGANGAQAATPGAPSRAMPHAVDPSRRPGTLQTWAGSFDLTRPLELPQELRCQPRLEHSSDRYYVVMLDPQGIHARGLDDLRRGIGARGGAVVGDMAVASLAARLGEHALRFARSHPVVRLVEPYHPAFKLSPEVARLRAAGAATASAATELDVVLFPGEPAADVAAAVRALGGSVVDIAPDSLRVLLGANRLAELAALDAVMAVFPHVPARVLGEEITAIMQTGQFRNGAKPFHAAGVDGSGSGLTPPQVLMLLDNGIQLDASELSDTSLVPGMAGLMHRKVLLYASTNAFGGAGDLLGCDAVPQGLFTHGHVMASVALGNASTVPPAYGAPWPAFKGRLLDGVAPGALLAAYDAQPTPAGICGDPLEDALTPGDLYAAPAGGSLGQAYTTPGRPARTFNFSWGAPASIYGAHASDVDQFLFDKKEAMLFQAAGNGGPDPGSIYTPGTAKNPVVVGATYGAHASLDQNDRWPFSSVGPANALGRIAPILMGPGADLPAPDAREAFTCITFDNEHAPPVVCDVLEAREGTSVAAAAASGAALLVRDYFQQGFYPDGTSTDAGNAADMVPAVSGALVKAVLVASADWVGDGNAAGTNLTQAYRFNNEQGYGRIHLTNALKLNSWIGSREGVLVVDGGIPGGVSSLALPGTIDTTVPGVLATVFGVLDDVQELRVALVWIEGPGTALVNDLDLKLSSPDPPGAPPALSYLGNYFTDDNDRSGVLLPGEDCPGIDGSIGALDASPWSLPECVNSVSDTQNPVEAIFLSADADADGDRDLDFNQIPLGAWTVSVATPGGGTTTAQPFALVITGGVTAAGAIVWNEGPGGKALGPGAADAALLVDCAQRAQFKVLETDEPHDPASGLTPAVISSRVVVQVVDAPTGTVVDEETGFPMTQPVAGILRFESGLLTPVVDDSPTSGNGLIEVEDGRVLRAIYADLESSGGVGHSAATFTIVCTPTPGAVAELRVEEFDAGTDDLTISYTPACAAADHTIVFGPLSSVSSYGYSGQACGIGTSGSYRAFDPGAGSFFFMVVGNDGASVEGSYGRNSNGMERPEQISDPVCSSNQDLTLPCD